MLEIVSPGAASRIAARTRFSLAIISYL